MLGLSFSRPSVIKGDRLFDRIRDILGDTRIDRQRIFFYLNFSSKSHVSQLGIKSLYLQCEDHNIDLYIKHGFQAFHQATHNPVKTTIMVYQTDA